MKAENNKKNLNNKEAVLNIIGAIIIVGINTLINFFLSPYIVKNLGVEINGYVALANNFISYFSLITIALNSMSGRFILLELKKNNLIEANKYYTSVLLGNWILGIFLLIPVSILIIYLDRFIKIDTKFLEDVRMLFIFVFLSFFINLLMPKWSNATFSTNKLYLRSLEMAITSIIRALIIFFSYKMLSPKVYYIGIAGIIMTIGNLFLEFLFKIKLLPELRVKFKYYSLKKIKILVTAGIWNTVSQCGNLLLEGLDILLANMFINPVASGLLAISKIIPNMINQVVGNIATTFGPKLITFFALNDTDKMLEEVKKNIKIVSIIANIPIGVTFIIGIYFFKLWVPSQDAKLLSMLSSLTLLGMLFSGISNCIINIFIAVNKLKLNSIMVIISGIINILIVYVLLNFTNLGIYIIASVSSIISIVRIFFFTAPYAACCIQKKWYVFYKPLIKGAGNVILPIIIGIICNLFINIDSWFFLILKIIIIIIFTIIIDYFFILNVDEKNFIKKIIKR